MTQPVFIGIDPGVTGAVASYCPEDGTWMLDDTPAFLEKFGRTQRRRIDPVGMLAVLRRHASRGTPQGAIEKVGAMPGQGVTSMFAFGRSLGVCETALLAAMVPLTWVTPQVWQRTLGVKKDASAVRVTELFPHLRPLVAKAGNHNRADAILMAYWLATRHSNERTNDTDNERTDPTPPPHAPK